MVISFSVWQRVERGQRRRDGGARAATGPHLKRAAPADPLRFMTIVCVVPPLPLLALSLAFEGPREIGAALAGADALGIGAVLYLAFAATTVGWGLWGSLMGRYPASTVAPFSLLGPVSGSRSALSCSASR